jgi:hypothetical protein
MAHSAVWYFQELARRVGLARMRSGVRRLGVRLDPHGRAGHRAIITTAASAATMPTSCTRETRSFRTTRASSTVLAG